MLIILADIFDFAADETTMLNFTTTVPDVVEKLSAVNGPTSKP